MSFSKRVDVELKKRWFKQKAGGCMATRRKSASKSRKMILTAVIGSLAALGVGGAGYVTWSALAANGSPQRSASVNAAEKNSTSDRSPHRASVASQSKTGSRVAKSRKLKSSTSCKISKFKTAKLAKHKASKHKRKKLRQAH